MYEYIKGIIDKATGNEVVIDVQGIGYLVYCPQPDTAALSVQTGSQVKLFVHYIHKEETVALYGFIKPETRDGFRSLLKVGGVGPKTAITMLSRYDIAKLAEYVENENIDLLKKIPGVGEKTAKKMILDLKGSLKTMAIANVSSYDRDLVAALTAMGYSEGDAVRLYEKGKPFSGVISDDIKKLLKLTVRNG